MMNWETKRLNEVLNYEQPTKYIVETTNYEDNYNTPVLTAGKSFLLGYTNETDGIFKNVPAIIFDDFTTAFHYVDFPFKVKSSAMKILKCDETKDDLRFLYYQMSRLKIDTQLHKRYWISKFSKLEFNRPLLKTQHRIVAILDDAVALRDKTVQLLKEYDLLSQSIFMEMFGDPSSFDHYRISEIAAKEKYSLSSGPFGSNLTSKHYTDKGVLILRGTNVTSGVLDLSNVKFVSEEKAVELRRSALRPGDVVIVAVGSSGKALKIPSTLQRAIMSQNFNKITPDKNKVRPMYLEFCFNSQSVQNQFKMATTDTVRTFLSLTKIKKVKIPVPPIDLQNQFEDKITLIEQQKELAKQELKESEDLFNCLLQKAFKGELK
jgi:type I restriction enzyme S subunit